MPASLAVYRRRAATATAVAWGLGAALRATGTERGFPLVPAMAFTPYAAAGSVLPLAVGLAARSRAAVLLSVASGAVLTAGALAHRSRPQAAAAPATDRLRVATVSLRRGLVPTASVLDLVRGQGVDVLAVQELTPSALGGLRDGGIERLLPHGHVLLAGPGRSVAASGAIWSWRPIAGRAAVPGTFEQPTVRLETAAGPVEVTAVHAKAPVYSPAHVRAWAADLTRLPLPEPGVLRVLAGDFNATPDHAALRAVVASGYVDAAAAVGRGREWTWRPLRLRLPVLTLDHVLVDPRISLARVAIVRVPGSDHRSVVADLELPVLRG